jgi:hypothetical protein
VFAQPDAKRQKASGDDRTDEASRALANPSAGDGEREEECEPEDDGDAANPRKHASAEQFLQVGELDLPLSRRNGTPGGSGPAPWSCRGWGCRRG